MPTQPCYICCVPCFADLQCWWENRIRPTLASVTAEFQHFRSCQWLAGFHRRMIMIMMMMMMMVVVVVMMMDTIHAWYMMHHKLPCFTNVCLKSHPFSSFTLHSCRLIYHTYPYMVGSHKYRIFMDIPGTTIHYQLHCEKQVNSPP